MPARPRGCHRRLAATGRCARAVSGGVAAAVTLPTEWARHAAGSGWARGAAAPAARCPRLKPQPAPSGGGPGRGTRMESVPRTGRWTMRVTKPAESRASTRLGTQVQPRGAGHVGRNWRGPERRTGRAHRYRAQEAATPLPEGARFVPGRVDAFEGRAGERQRRAARGHREPALKRRDRMYILSVSFVSDLKMRWKCH
jgi:hypothetical protein